MKGKLSSSDHPGFVVCWLRLSVYNGALAARYFQKCHALLIYPSLDYQVYRMWQCVIDVGLDVVQGCIVTRSLLVGPLHDMRRISLFAGSPSSA